MYCFTFNSFFKETKVTEMRKYIQVKVTLMHGGRKD